MAPRDKKGILFILRAVVQSYLSALCVHSRLANVLLRFNLDNKFQRGGGTESFVREQTLENQSRKLPESALSSRSPQLRKAFLSLLAILSAFKWVYLSFSPLLFTSLLFTAICKASSDNHLAFLHFFFLGMVLINTLFQQHKRRLYT